MPRNQYYFCSRNNTGNLTEAGLPNITGKYGFGTDINTTFFGASKMSLNTGSGRYISSGGTGFYEAGFDASLSNSIYGNSTTVQPLSVNCYLEFYIN